MIGVVVGPPSKAVLAERRRKVVHELAAAWPGPACNQGLDPAVRLVVGQLVVAGRVTCWCCRNGGAR